MCGKHLATIVRDYGSTLSVLTSVATDYIDLAISSLTGRIFGSPYHLLVTNDIQYQYFYGNS